MDHIEVSQMEFYGYHGVFSEENRLGQRFIVDLNVTTELNKAGESDNLEYSINYAELYSICREIVEGAPFKLIEAVAEKIAQEVLKKYPAAIDCTVKVIKPDPPIPGHLQHVAVEIKRGR